MVRGLRISEEVIQKIIASDTDITTLAVSADGKLYAWGSGASGLVITDDKGNTTTPDSKGDAEPSFSPDGMQLLLRASAPVIKRYL